jgi:hypothetical protein
MPHSIRPHVADAIRFTVGVRVSLRH